MEKISSNVNRDRDSSSRWFLRRHPIVSAWIALTLAPVLLAIFLLAVRFAPACSEWRNKVQAAAEDAMGARYMGLGRPPLVDAAYRSEGSGYADIMKSLLRTAEYEMADTRPFACL